MDINNLHQYNHYSFFEEQDFKMMREVEIHGNKNRIVSYKNIESVLYLSYSYLIPDIYLSYT